MKSMNQYEIDYQQGYDACNDKWIDKLEQIRAEIEIQKYSISLDDDNLLWYQTGIDDVLKIIDEVINEVNK